MSYQITWAEDTKERLRTGIVFLNAGDRRGWLIDRIVEHVEKELAAYPQDSAAPPGQRITGELHVVNCDVRYELHTDTHTALITGVEAHPIPARSITPAPGRMPTDHEFSLPTSSPSRPLQPISSGAVVSPKASTGVPILSSIET